MSGEIVPYKGRGKGLDDPSKRLGPRRTIDYGSEVVRWLEGCLAPHRTARNLPFHYSFTKELLPPFAAPQFKHDAICCRFVHSSTQKNRAPVNVVHWFPNGRRLLSGSQTGEITIWNGQQFHFENIMQAHNAAVKAMEWTSDENVLVSGDQLGVIKYWDQYLYNFQSFQGHKDSVCDITVAPTGMKFCSCADDSHAKVWDLRTATEERAFTGHGWDVKCCSWHPSKGLVATGSKDSQIKLWDPRASEAITTIYCHKNTVTKVRWSPNGLALASGSRDNLVMLMDIRTLSVREVFKAHTKEVTALCWHPENDGILATGGYDSAMHFWDTHGGNEPLESIPGAHEGPIWSMAWHPLGHLLATASHDYSTRFWSRPRPGDTNFVDLLPKKIAAPDRDAAAVAAALLDRTTTDKVFSSGIFAPPPLPPAPEKEPEPEVLPGAIEDGTADAEGEQEPEKNEPAKLLPGLSQGSISVLDASDFDDVDPAAAPPASPAKPAASSPAAPPPPLVPAESQSSQGAGACARGSEAPAVPKMRPPSDPRPPPKRSPPRKPPAPECVATTGELVLDKDKEAAIAESGSLAAAAPDLVLSKAKAAAMAAVSQPAATHGSGELVLSKTKAAALKAAGAGEIVLSKAKAAAMALAATAPPPPPQAASAPVAAAAESAPVAAGESLPPVAAEAAAERAAEAAPPPGDAAPLAAEPSVAEGMEGVEAAASAPEDSVAADVAPAAVADAQGDGAGTAEKRPCEEEGAGEPAAKRLRGEASPTEQPGGCSS